jgi:hypothetical protein
MSEWIRRLAGRICLHREASADPDGLFRKARSGPATRVVAGVVYLTGDPTGLRVEVEQLFRRDAEPEYRLKLQFRADEGSPHETLVTLPVAAVGEVKALLDESVRFIDSMRKSWQ